MSTSFNQDLARSHISERGATVVRRGRSHSMPGYWICGAGIGVVLSAFLPWVSVDGLYASHPSGGGVLLLLVIGGLLVHFGTRVFGGHLSRASNVALWVISGVDVLVSLALFGSLSKLNNEGAGLVSVQPSIGFYTGIGSLMASVVGTVLVQIARHKHTAGGE
jgi:hypothetical protein